MSTLKSKTEKKPSPFVDTPQLFLSTETNGSNQIINFKISYRGQTIEFPVKNFNIFEAWQKLEAFVIKQNAKKK